MLDICLAMDTLDGRVESKQSSCTAQAKQASVKAEAILLVDDDDLYVRAITRQLRSLGYPYVFRACSAAEAIDMLQRVRPTLVLTDMVMEHREAGQWVIAAAEQLGVSVAVVSGMTGIEESSVGIRFCNKSDLDARRLEELVDELIAQSRNRAGRAVRSSDRVVVAPSSSLPSDGRKTA
ncbi:MAG TPA: response regulator [Polyangiaceae bacterium]